MAAQSKKLGKLNRVTPLQAVGIVILGLVGLCYLWPLFWLLDSSFRSQAEIFPISPLIIKGNLIESLEAYSLNSFRDAFGHWHVGWAFMISVFVTLAGITLTLLVCSLCAYAFAYLEFPGKNALFIGILGTMMLPMTTMIVPYYRLMSALRLDSVEFHPLGFLGKHLPSLSHLALHTPEIRFTNSLNGIIIPYAASALGVFLLRQYYIKIPRALMESARIDGASHLKIWWNVIVPLSRPALAALAIFQFRTIWNDFLVPMILLKGEERFTLPVRIQVMDSQHFNKPFEAIIATGFIFTLVPTIFFLIFQRQFIEGLTGGIKE